MDSSKIHPFNEDMLCVLTLRNEKTGEYYDVLRKKTHLVARAGFNGDLEIPNDTTVSRTHAEIFLVKNKVGNNMKLCLMLVDKKSKFGTFINEGIVTNEQIANDYPITLEIGDRIRFGMMESTWTVMTYPIVACPSTLKMTDKEILKNSMIKLGGKVTREWSEQCTHLCMNTITVTEKVLICLASAKSIVFPKYFTDLCEALLCHSSKELPFCVDYKPNLAENLLNSNSVSMAVNNKRKTLFTKKIFICSTIEQLNRISKIIQAAGGDTIYYFNNVVSDNIMFNSKEYIFMQQDPHNLERKKEYRQVLEKVEEMNKRPIPENDIGLAIIFSSTAKHCNPNYNTSLVNLQSQQSNVSQMSDILAIDTEILTVIGESETFSVNVIQDSQSENVGGFKRPLEIEMNPYEFEIPKKRTPLLNDTEKNNISRTINFNEHKILIEPTPPENNHTLKLSKSIKPVSEDVIHNSVDSNETTMSNIQNMSIKNNYMTLLQTTIENKNEKNNSFNIPPLTVEDRSTVKRKILNCHTLVNNKDSDPFNYIDIDEIEKHPKKKSRTEHIESIYFPVIETNSNNNSIQSQSIKSKANKAIDPSFIMNLLSEAKGTGEFIDTTKPSDKCSVFEDSKNDNLVDSVIIKTKTMVRPKPSQTQNPIHGNCSNLPNFKQFKRKAKATRIPYIVPMELV